MGSEALLSPNGCVAAEPIPDEGSGALIDRTRMRSGRLPVRRESYPTTTRGDQDSCLSQRTAFQSMFQLSACAGIPVFCSTYPYPSPAQRHPLPLTPFVTIAMLLKATYLGVRHCLFPAPN